jgi:hypothetical protein
VLCCATACARLIQFRSKTSKFRLSCQLFMILGLSISE